jgi:hypothetical protein
MAIKTRMKDIQNRLLAFTDRFSALAPALIRIASVTGDLPEPVPNRRRQR